MNDSQSLSKDVLKNRLEKIKEQKLLASTAQSPSSNSTSTTSSSIVAINAKPSIESSQKNTTLNHNSTSFNHQDVKETFKEALNNNQSNANSNNKEKLGLFVQQANETFQNYEKEIGELKQKLALLSSFQINKLIISQSGSTISLTLSPSHEQLFNRKMRKMTEEEGASMNEILQEYNSKISELFEENASLSLMIDKLSFDVVNTLQEKIQELGTLLKKEKGLKDLAQKQLKSMDSVFQQNSDMKASLVEKDKVIVMLHSQVTELKGQLEEHKSDLSGKMQMIASLTKSIETKDKKNSEQGAEIEELKKTIAKQFETLNVKKKETKDKDEEIQILFNDNVQWEEKYKLQSKEIENFKKWSLWDEDLIESYKKIEGLNNSLLAKEETIDTLTEKIESLSKSNDELIADIKAKKKTIQEVKSDNDSLNIVKLNYEKEKEKLANFDLLSKENASFKKEIMKTVERYEGQIKTDRKNYESQLTAATQQLERDIDSIKKDKEKMIGEKERLIQALECKVANSQSEYSELSNQFEKKNELLTNLKEVYDNMVKKLKTQEEKIQALEKGVESNNAISTNSHHHHSNQIESKIEDKQETKAKVYSTFDKYAFTKEIMIDYLFILFLFESSVNIQHILDNLLRNINTYFHTIFQRQSNPKSMLSELLEDVFLIAFDKLLNNKLQSEGNSNNKTNFSYQINFEQFNRDTINEICELIISSNPLSRFKNKKSLEEIEQLFISKYSKSFDFDESLEAYLSENVVPLVAARIEKYDKVIFDDAHTLVEISLNNIKDGLVMIDNNKIYSYEHFFNEYKCIQSTGKKPKEVRKDKDEENEDEEEEEDDEQEPEPLYLTGELKKEEAIDNILYRIKYNEPLEVSFNGVFDKNSELVLSRIVSSIMIYTPCLEVLCLKNNHLGGYLSKNYICKLIRQLKDLKTLDMTNTQIDDEDFKLICEELKSNKTIETLIFNNNNLRSSSGIYLADVVLANKTISSLSLDNNQLNESGLSTLLKVLANKKSKISQLSIGYNNLTQEDFSALGEYLNEDPVITFLDISGNNVEPQSANLVGVAFRKATNLVTLKANFIGLNEVSSAQFLNFINETNIETIELDKNLFGESGTILLINKIKASSKLKRMTLRMCEISSTYLGLIAQLIKSNTTLEELNLENNLFDDEGVLSFCKTIECNQHVVVTFSKGNISKKACDAIAAYKNIRLI